VSVTQSFNTTTSMGRLTLNMLLSFAQFEREVTAALNLSLIKLLVKARRWWTMLRGGEVDIKTLAAREGMQAPYLTQVLRLAFLSPGGGRCNSGRAAVHCGYGHRTDAGIGSRPKLGDTARQTGVLKEGEGSHRC